MHTLDAFVAEVDLPLELAFGAREVGLDSVPSEEGKRGVPGGVSSLMK